VGGVNAVVAAAALLLLLLMLLMLLLLLLLPMSVARPKSPILTTPSCTTNVGRFDITMYHALCMQGRPAILCTHWQK
jgi:hypothetical protein